MIEKEVQEFLLANSEESYGDFTAKLTPSIDRKTIIGVRVPALRKYAKELIKQNKQMEFLAVLPHKYYEENILHSILLEQIKDFDTTVAALKDFLPYVDSWAVCDTMHPRAFTKNTNRLMPYIQEWIGDSHTYTIRFGISMLMTFYLGSEFNPRQLELVAGIKSDEYYVNMMRAWYFATALAKQYDSTIIILEEKCLDVWTHNKTIRKAIESYRISDEAKAYLRSLAIK